MDSSLSLDELHVSFPRQGSNLRKRIVEGEDRADHPLMKDSGERGNSHYREVDRERSKSETFLSGNYVLADRGRETEDARRFPSIRCPASGKQKNGSRKGRSQGEKGEFSCIDLEDFSTWGKPAMIDTTTRDVKGKTNLRNSLKSPRPYNCIGGEKIKSGSIGELYSLENCSGRVHDTRSCLSLGEHYSDTHRQNRSLSVFTPPVSPKPELALDEKIFDFIEMEFAIVKGENVNSTRRRRNFPALPESARTRERGSSFHSLSVESSKSQAISIPELKKPMITSTKTNTEDSQRDEGNKRYKLPSPRLRNSSDFEKFENGSVSESCVVSKKHSISQKSRKLPLKLDLNGATEWSSSEKKGFLTTLPRDASPRLSPKEFRSNERPLFGESFKGQRVQELPLDLPQKVTSFIELEFSIIKGENASLSQKQKYGVSTDSVSLREKAPLSPNSVDLRKSEQSLSPLQRRGKVTKNSSLNMK